jgi:hypothetical protein
MVKKASKRNVKGASEGGDEITKISFKQQNVSKGNMYKEK